MRAWAVKDTYLGALVPGMFAPTQLAAVDTVSFLNAQTPYRDRYKAVPVTITEIEEGASDDK